MKSKPSRDPNKRYSDDRLLPYKSTTLRSIDSKRDIDALLAYQGLTKIFWTWDPNSFQKIELRFELTGAFKDQPNPWVKIKPPIIWKIPKRSKPEEIDERLSMRLLFWYLKNALAWAYAKQSQRITAFLGNIQVNDEMTIQDLVLDRFEQLKTIKALSDSTPGKHKKSEKVIDI